MHYEVRVAATGGGEETRFELERDEPLIEGQTFAQLSMVYKVLQILPGHGDFDAVVKAIWGKPGSQGVSPATRPHLASTGWLVVESAARF